MKILVKLSGDLVGNDTILNQIVKLIPGNQVTLIHGAGVLFYKTLRRNKLAYEHERQFKFTSQRALELCMAVCNMVRTKLEDRFIGTGIKIVSPMHSNNGKIFYINADQLFENSVICYDKGIVYSFTVKPKPELDRFGHVEIIRVRNNG